MAPPAPPDTPPVILPVWAELESVRTTSPVLISMTGPALPRSRVKPPRSMVTDLFRVRAESPASATVFPVSLITSPLFAASIWACRAAQRPIQTALRVTSPVIRIFVPGVLVSVPPGSCHPRNTLPSGAVKALSGRGYSVFTWMLTACMVPLPPPGSKETIRDRFSSASGTFPVLMAGSGVSWTGDGAASVGAGGSAGAAVFPNSDEPSDVGDSGAFPDWELPQAQSERSRHRASSSIRRFFIYTDLSSPIADLGTVSPDPQSPIIQRTSCG